MPFFYTITSLQAIQSNPMKFSTPHTLKSIAELFNIGFEGDPDLPVLGCNEIHVVEEGDIVFLRQCQVLRKSF